MFDAELPNELILIAASAIADSRCGKMKFSMLDTCEFQVLTSLDPSVGDCAQDVYFIVRSRSGLPMQVTVTDSYSYDPDALQKEFVSLQDCIDLAIAHFHEIEAVS